MDYPLNSMERFRLPRSILVRGLFLCLIAGTVPSARAQTPAPGQTWTYRLLEGSTFYRDCPICGSPIVLQPLRGTFDLVLLEDAGTVVRYALRNLTFSASNPGGEADHIVGQGTYVLFSPGPLQPIPEMTLQASINDAIHTYVFTIDTNAPAVDRAWPVLQVSLVETQQATVTQVHHMNLLTAPLREIWFSTASGFTASNWQSPTNCVSAGDLISDAGRVVRSSSRLLASFGLMPGLTEIGADAIEVAPGGEVLFSINEDVLSETLGPIHHGDLLSEGGRIVKRNQDLLAAFNLGDTDTDFGLDAFQMMTNGELYFSITTRAVAPELGPLSVGDVLSDQGRIVKHHVELLANFHPPPSFAEQDYGLGALYVWPSGETWFSLETGFDDVELGPILEGDLLSDQGYIVFRNLELTSAFAPIEDTSSFGLDALYLVTDATAPAPPPEVVSLHHELASGNIALRWEGVGRVFQGERSLTATGPFRPASAIVPDLTWTDLGASQTNDQTFYRVRQW